MRYIVDHFNNWRRINPWVLFLPLLGYFVSIAILIRVLRPAMLADEDSYILLAKNILNGFYSDPLPKLNLWFGPGLPLLLVPFVYLGINNAYWCVFNGLMYYISTVLMFKTIDYLRVNTFVIVVTLSIWIFFLPAYLEVSHIATEPLAFALITSFIYYWLQYSDFPNTKNLIGSGLSLGYLALVKVLFGYIILTIIIISIFSKVVRRSKPSTLMLKVSILALLITLPWLTYTYKMTGKVFYWGNSGGMQLYWMSTPYPDEFGSWDEGTEDNTHLKKDWSQEHRNELAKNHKAVFTEVHSAFPYLQDDIWRKHAIENIKAHPLKYIYNIGCNFSRLLFGVPITTYVQSGKYIMYIPTGSFSFMSIIFIIGYYIVHFKRISANVRYIALIGALYMGATLLLSTYPRMLVPLAPILLIVLADVVNRVYRTLQKS